MLFTSPHFHSSALPLFQLSPPYRSLHSPFPTLPSPPSSTMPSLSSFLFFPIPSIPSPSLPSPPSLPPLLPLPFHSPTRRATTRLRLDQTEAGPTPPHSTLLHVQVTECSTATDTHAAGAQDGSQSALTAGPNTTHKHIIRTETAVYADERGSGKDSTTAVMSCWQRGQREQLQPQFAPRLSLLQYCGSIVNRPTP